MYWTRVTINTALNSVDYKSTLHNTRFLKALPSILKSKLNLSFIVWEETCMESTNDLYYIFWDDSFTIHNICLLSNCNMIYTSRSRYEKWRGILNFYLENLIDTIVIYVIVSNILCFSVVIKCGNISIGVICII